MRRPAAIATVVALFTVGVAVGVFGTHFYFWHQMHQPHGRFGTRIIAADLERRLDLNAEQRKQVDAILADSQREAMVLRHEMWPRVAALLSRTQERIEAVLTPAQRQEFESYRRGRGSRLRHLLFGH